MNSLQVEDYKVLMAKGTDDLNVEVAEHLDKGWELYGPHQLSTYQVKEKDGSVRLKLVLTQAVVLPLGDEVEK